MNLQIELFTTPTVEDRKILSSKGFVCANVVFDAGVIDDVHIKNITLPNYLDTDEIEPYHVELFEALEKEVHAKGANAVIDLHIEHSYVHRKDAYYILISAQGTAVELDAVNKELLENKNINGKVLEQQILCKHIQTKLKEWRAKYDETVKEGKDVKRCYCKLSTDEWVFICRYPVLSFADEIHLAFNERVLYVQKIENHSIYKPDVTYSFHDGIFDRYYYYKYFKKLPYEKQIELAYKYSGWISANLIVECDLFDAKQILAWAQKGEYEFATECLKARKKEYSSQDLEDMQELYEYFANLPEKPGHIEEVKDDRYRPAKIIRKYTCSYCNCGDVLLTPYEEISYCRYCKKGAKGLTKEQEERIQDFGIKIETLKELLS